MIGLWLALLLGAGVPAQGATNAPEAISDRQAAQIRAHLGDTAGAEELLARALRSNPRDAKALFLLAQVARERPHEAVAYADRAARLMEDGPGRAAAYRLLGEIRLDLGDQAGARTAFQRALSLDAGDLDALQALIRLERARPSEALRYARQALRAAENAPLWLRPTAHGISARLWLELKNDAKAAESLRRLLEVDPDDLDALTALVEIHQRGLPKLSAQIAGDRQSEDRTWTAWTKEALQRARRFSPEGLETLRLNVAQSQAQGQPQEAAAYAGRLAAAVPDAPLWQQAAAYRLSARIWRALGDEAMAMESARAASHMEPESLQTVQLLASDTMVPDERQRQQKLLIIPDFARHLAGLLEHSGQLWRELQDEARAQVRFQQALELLQGDVRRAAGTLEKTSPAERAETHRASAQLKLKQKDHAGAEKDLEELLLLAPGDAQALLSLAELELDRGQPEKALAYAKRTAGALEKEPASNRPALYRRAIRIRLELKDVAGAESDLLRLLQLVPDDAGALQNLTQSELERGRPQEALAYADRLAKALKNAAPAKRAAAYRQSARIRIELKDDAGAETDLLRTLELAPADRETLQMLILNQLNGGRLRKALVYAERLAGALKKADPEERAAAYRQNARIRLELQDDAGAENDLQRALKLAPNDRQTLQLLAHVTLRRGRPAEARAYAARLTGMLEKASPAERADAYRQSARIRARLKDAAGAESDFRRLLDLVPDDLEALQTLARSELERGRPKEARATAARSAATLAQAAPAERAAAHRLDARISLALDDEASAESSLLRALEAAPDDRQALQMLAQGKLRRGQPQEALVYGERLAGTVEKALPAERAAAHRLNARIRLELKDQTGAEKEFRQALELTPDDLEALRSLVQARRQEPKEAAALVAKHWPAQPRPRARWLALRGLTRMLAKDLAGARLDFEEAAKADAPSFCSDELFQIDRDRLDAGYFETCLRRFPKDAALYADRGVARYLAGAKDAAAADFRKATALKADFPEAYLSLALILAKQGRPQAALETVDRGLEKASDRRSGSYERLTALQQALRGAQAPR